MFSEFCCHLHYADCAGKEQSPIDIVTSGVSQVAETTPLSFSNYDVAMVELLNNGHTAVSLPTFSVALHCARWSFKCID